MLLALLSDTHDDERATRAALALLKSHRPAVYLHAGDMVSPTMLPLFQGLPFHFVFGNNEYDHAALRAQARANALFCHDLSASLDLGGRRIALLHGHDQPLLNRLARSGDYHYLIHGHSHARRDQQLNTTRLINPGAVHRARPRSVALLDLDSDSLQFLDVALPD